MVQKINFLPDRQFNMGKIGIFKKQILKNWLEALFLPY